MAACDSCCEVVSVSCVLPCLHGLCGLCAKDAAAQEAPVCPRCREAVTREDLGANASGLSTGAEPASVSGEVPASASWPELNVEASVALARAQRVLDEAHDMLAFATENARRVPADIRAAYASPELADAFHTRRDAFLAEAETLLCADVKTCTLGVEDAQALVSAARECLELVEACKPPDAQRASGPLMKRLEMRAATLNRRALGAVPSLGSTIYFAHAQPLTRLTEPHAFLGRTLLWHARWSEWDYGHARALRAETKLYPVAATPDGRLLAIDLDGPNGCRSEPAFVQMPDGQWRRDKTAEEDAIPPVTRVSWGQGEEALLLPHKIDSWLLQDVQVDGAGRIWAHNWIRLMCWAPDGAVIHDVTVCELLQQWDMGHHGCGQHGYGRLHHVAVAPCGTVIVNIDCLSITFAATPDLKTLLWIHDKMSDSACFIAVVRSNTVFLAPCQLSGNLIITNNLLCLDVHTGVVKSREQHPEIQDWDFRAAWRGNSPAKMQGRLHAVRNVWLPATLDGAMPSLTPAGPVAGRVHQVRDLVLPPPPECSVLGLHGRLYRAVLPKDINPNALTAEEFAKKRPALDLSLQSGLLYVD